MKLRRALAVIAVGMCCAAILVFELAPISDFAPVTLPNHQRHLKNVRSAFMTFPPFKFPFHGFANEVRPVLVITQNGVNPLECASYESGLHVLGPTFYASHAIISHMRY